MVNPVGKVLVTLFDNILANPVGKVWGPALRYVTLASRYQRRPLDVHPRSDSTEYGNAVPIGHWVRPQTYQYRSWPKTFINRLVTNACLRLGSPCGLGAKLIYGLFCELVAPQGRKKNLVTTIVFSVRDKSKGTRNPCFTMFSMVNIP